MAELSMAPIFPDASNVPPPLDRIDPFECDHVGPADAHGATLATGLISPVATFRDSYLSMLQVAVRVGEMTFNVHFLHP
jgi:hypothetical protein